MATGNSLTERSDSYSVSVNAPPAFVWATLANVEDWPRFSPFALQVNQLSPTRYELTSPQGPVILTSNFVEDLGLLDHTVTLRRWSSCRTGRAQPPW